MSRQKENAIVKLCFTLFKPDTDLYIVSSIKYLNDLVKHVGYMIFKVEYFHWPPLLNEL